MQITANLHDCKHCSGTGTCKNGKDSTSCLACAKRNELWYWQRSGQQGLLCASCGGIGKAEPYTERLNKRAAPLLAILLVFSIIMLIFVTALMKSPFFSEILAFSSAITGSVAGFYFSRARDT